jgi:hypothetical protein
MVAFSGEDLVKNEEFKDQRRVKSDETDLFGTLTAVLPAAVEDKSF